MTPAVLARSPFAIRGCTAVIALSSVAWSQGTSCAQDSIDFDLIPLTGLEGQSFVAVELNDAGQVAGQILATQPGGVQQAFVWQNGQLVTHAFPGSTVSVSGLSDGGLVVGNLFAAGSPPQTFLWDSATDTVDFAKAPFEHYPADVNDARTVVGLDADGLFGYALDATTGEATTIAFGQVPTVGVGTSGAVSINAAGVAVGGEVVFEDGAGMYLERPYRWSERDGIEDLAMSPTGFGGRAVDVSPGGNVAGTVLDEFLGHQSAYWSDQGQTLTTLGSPFGYFVSDALAVNDLGQVVVVAPNDLFGFTRGFLWQNGSFTDLSCFVPSGLFVARPVDVNNDGEILVQLTNSGGLSIVGTGILRPVNPPVLALEEVRLGTPPNPNAFLAGQTSAPIVGAVWDPAIDHAVFATAATQDFALLALSPTNLPLAGLGTLLCDPTTVFQTLATAAGTPFQVPIPNDPVLPGLQLCTQGASLQPSGLILANALDVTLGNL
ncbi:hypothetical protein [Engelhardtia mirabilis]|uniref:Uncharacterized protein n=1 Tax=Engelhardtia mirabilis TaxID=2528011 RepID=A0A518BNJ7_9BACT|nr:hypothetical protein Pla133_36390 [Planctomycetes bacterium Pla133]QDV02866.1 hypothetical protein Pla86_36370 [Planctomycetes bacterium Pla86]